MPELYNSYKKIKDLKILPKILNIYNRLIDILAAKAVIWWTLYPLLCSI